MEKGNERGEHNFESETTIADLVENILGFVSPRSRGRLQGRPDAIRATGPTSGIYFDFKPVTHVNNPELQARDAVQAAKWEAAAKSAGVTLKPASPDEIAKAVKDRAIIGQIVGTDLNNYDVKTYTGQVPGIAYYSLTKKDSNVMDNARQNLGNWASDAASVIMDGLERGPSINFPVPLPGSRPRRP